MVKLRILVRRKHIGHAHLHVANKAAGGDIGLRHLPAKEPRRAAVMLQFVERGRNLLHQPLFEVTVDVLVAVEQPLKGQRNALVHQSMRQHHRLQHLAPLRPMRRRQRAGWSRHLVQVVDDGGGVDQHLTRFQNQRRYAHQRIDLSHLLHVAEHRDRIARVRHAVVIECHRHTPRKGRVELANEDHAQFVARS